jgi:hypothetical protein
MLQERKNFRSVIPTVVEEFSLLVLWLLSTPLIGNYMAVNKIFAPVWYTSIFFGHMLRWFLLYYRRKTLPGLRWMYNAPFIPLMILWGFILGGEVRLINAYYPFVLVLFACAVSFLHWFRRLHGWTISAIFGCLIILSLYYRLYTLTGIYTGLIALFTFGGVLFRRSIYQVPVWVAALALTNLVVVFVLFHFRFVTGEHLDRISTNPAVERLFVYDNTDPVGRMVGKNIMIIQEACEPDTYLVGSHDGEFGLLLVDHNKRVAHPSLHIRDCSNDILVNCIRHEAMAGAFNRPGGLYVFDLQNWPTLTKPVIPVPGKVVYMIFDKTNDQYLVFPKARILFAVDAQTGSISGALRGPDERAYDPKNNEVVTLTEPDFSIMRIKLENIPKAPFRILHKRYMEVPIYKRLQMYFHPGPIDGTTLVTNLWDGTVTLYSRNFRPLRQTYIAPGISGMALTKDKRHLAIGGYTDGNLYFMDMKTWKVVTNLYLGHRMREIRISRDGRYIYIGTSQGGFRINISRVLEHAFSSLQP